VRVVVVLFDSFRLHHRERAFKRPEPPTENGAFAEEPHGVSPDHQSAALGPEVVRHREESFTRGLRKLEGEQHDEHCGANRGRPVRGSSSTEMRKDNNRAGQGCDESGSRM
jgi:hypothetical protein